MGLRHLASLVQESSVGLFRCGIILSLRFLLWLLTSPAPSTLLPSRMLLFSRKSTPSGLGEAEPAPACDMQGVFPSPCDTGPADRSTASTASEAGPPTDAVSMTGPKRLQCSAGGGDASSFSSPAARCRGVTCPRGGSTHGGEGWREPQSPADDWQVSMSGRVRTASSANELLLFVNLTLGPASRSTGRSNR